VIFLAILLNIDKVPRLGAWAEPAHFTSSLFLAIAVAAVLLAGGMANGASQTGWLTLIVVTMMVVLLECLQPIFSARNFEFQDMIDGVAGGASGGLLSAALVRWLGFNRFFNLSITASVLVLLVVSGLSLKPRPPVTACSAPSPVVDWSLAVIDDFKRVGEQIHSSNAVFCEFAAGVDTDDGELVLQGGAVASAPLKGLLKASAQSGQLTFGVRFKSDTDKRPRWPGVVASVVRGDHSGRTFARVLWRGKNLFTSIRLNPFENTSTSISKRVSDRYHEVVIVYDGEWQTTWFDGEAVGFERTLLDPPAAQDILTLELGWRKDDRWQPFRGRIDSIVIAGEAVQASEIASLFNGGAQQ
jgi:hypothetical protein